MVSSIKRDWFIYLFLIAITLIVYSQVTEFEFVHYDDDVYVTENNHVKTGFTLANLKHAFTLTEDGNWIPLVWISLMTDHVMSVHTHSDEYGNDENPAVYHRTNLILHLLNTLLLFTALSAMTGLRWRSAVVAAIFAVHPLHVESVAWVAERKDVLSTLFMMLTLCVYLWYVKRPCIGRYLLVAAIFVLGLMSKQMLVTLPIVLLLLDMWPLKRNMASKKTPGEPLRKLILEKIPLLMLAFAASVATVLAQGHQKSVMSLVKYPLGVRLDNSLVSYISYIAKTFLPMKLACFYPHPSNTLPIWQVVACGLVLVALTIAAIRVARKLPYLTVGWLWYLITLLPVIGIVQVGFQAMADRYAYITQIGLSIAIVWGVSELLIYRRAGILKLGVLSGLVIACLMVRAHSQASVWKNDLALFTHAVDVTSNNAIAQYNLANHLMDNGQLDIAIAHFREAVRIDPNKSDAHNNLGIALYKQSNFSEAMEHFKTAVRLRPNYVDAHLNIASILMSQKNNTEAISHLEIVHRIQPNNQSIIKALRDLKAGKPALR